VVREDVESQLRSFRRESHMQHLLAITPVVSAPVFEQPGVTQGVMIGQRLSEVNAKPEV